MNMEMTERQLENQGWLAALDDLCIWLIREAA
jgi:hypothetical protein